MTKIIIFGNGEIASLSKYYFNSISKKIDFFCVDDDFIKESKFENTPILPFSELKNKPLYRKIHFKKFSELRNFITNSKGSTGFDQNYLPWKIYQYLESSNKKIIQMPDPANTLKLVNVT